MKYLQISRRQLFHPWKANKRVALHPKIIRALKEPLGELIPNDAITKKKLRVIFGALNC